MRSDGRKNDQIRHAKITRNYIKHAEGSVLIEVGDTKVICTASIEEKVPPFLKGTGEGWITAEYNMLPRSTSTRKPRDISRLKVDGRTMEIQRLIGRALRSVVDLKALGEKTIWIDCDVIQADGGTRTTSICGAFVALVDAMNKLHKQRPFKVYPIRKFLCATSVGIVGEEKLLDLCYEEDSTARVDMNVIGTDEGEFVEIQGTGEEAPFNRKELNELLDLAEKGIKQMIQLQKECLKMDSLWIGTGSSMKKIILASNNIKKIKEIKEILKGCPYEVYSLKDMDINIEVEEDGLTFEENAKKKAMEIYEYLLNKGESNFIVLSDDSGLEVDCLNGAPGVYSARYAGEHGNDYNNNIKLLEEMKSFKGNERSARFVCVIAVVFEDGSVKSVRGEVEGTIIEELKTEGGFGYDPLFFYKGFNKTFGEATPEEKNAISHRGNALKKLREILI